MDATTWAIALALARAADALDAACANRSGEERLAREGREALFRDVPLTIGGDYPDGTDDDWCHEADLAYAAAVRAWRRDRDRDEMLADARAAVALGRSVSRRRAA